MFSFEEIKKHLPQYLSEISTEKLFEGLRDFPGNIDKRLYTSLLSEKETLFQGDCLKCMPFMLFAENKMVEIPAMIISNTCDNSQTNRRPIPVNLLYAPIIKISKITSLLFENGIEEKVIHGLLESIRKQKKSQLFYLPVGSGITEESVVFLDRINSCENVIADEDIPYQRYCSLSDYGFYLFLYKLSIHFTRIREKVDRGAGAVL